MNHKFYDATYFPTYYTEILRFSIQQVKHCLLIALKGLLDMLNCRVTALDR